MSRLTKETGFGEYFNEIAVEAHKMAVEKGFWTPPQGVLKAINVLQEKIGGDEDAKQALRFLDNTLSKRNDGEAIALLHSELSEGLEWLRKPEGARLSENIDAQGIEEELADVIIRLMDLAVARNYNVARAVLAKMAYNKNRLFRHGKAF